jgi:hypothetical protein
MSHHVAEAQPAAREHETLVIARHEHGYRVYAPHNPHDVFIVGGGLGAPTCTCAGFDQHRHDPDWRCEHILAVLRRIGAQADTSPDHEALEERRAIQEEGGVATASASQMLLKRSVSPDGRIDSLSVELTCPVDGIPAADIEARARHALSIQAAIVAGFLGKDAPVPSSRPHDDQRARQPGAQHGGDGAVPATFLGVGGMDTRWGRRLFIDVQVDDRVLKLFGSPKQLGRALSDAGHQQHADYVDEGMQLNLPCRVTTKPSDNGRYVNIDRVFPADRSHTGWNSGQ